MSDEVEQVETDVVDPILRYASAMLLGLLIAGFLGIWLEVGFRTGAAVGVPVGILVAYLLGRESEGDA